MCSTDMEKVYYFDNAATTFPKHENVYKAMDEANRDYAVNAGRGAYALARKASEVISETRQQIMELTETENVAEVVFTASATLACNEIFGGIDWKKKTNGTGSGENQISVHERKTGSGSDVSCE